MQTHSTAWGGGLTAKKRKTAFPLKGKVGASWGMAEVSPNGEVIGGFDMKYGS